MHVSNDWHRSSRSVLLPAPTAPATLVGTADQAAFEQARAFAGQSLSQATLRAYRADWAHFADWCQAASVTALPADPVSVAAYLASQATTHARATIQRRLAAIAQAHRLRGLEWQSSHPAIRHTCRGMFRQHGVPSRKAAALGTAEIRKLVGVCDEGLTGLRDRALLLLGYAGALRRAELVAIACEHVTIGVDGLRIILPRSKSDQIGQGAEIGIPRGQSKATCPVRALERWLERSGVRYGPIFRKVDTWGVVEDRALHPDAVRRILHRRAIQAGLKVPSTERLSAHGLRAGFVTEAYKAGARDEEIMAHTRHRDLRTMRGYVRRAALLDASPVKLLGL